MEGPDYGLFSQTSVVGSGRLCNRSGDGGVRAECADGGNERQGGREAQADVSESALPEDRTRGPGAWTSGLGSIDATKRGRIRRAGERLWQRRYRHDASVDHLRFDAASVTFDGEQPLIEYVAAAF